MKKLYFLDEQEKNRILNLHTEATKKQYLSEKKLLNEAAPPIYTFIKSFFKKKGNVDLNFSKANKYLGQAFDSTLQKLLKDEKVLWSYGTDGKYLRTGPESFFDAETLEDILNSFGPNTRLSQTDIDKVLNTVPEQIIGYNLVGKTNPKFPLRSELKNELNKLEKSGIRNKAQGEAENIFSWTGGKIFDILKSETKGLKDNWVKYLLYRAAAGTSLYSVWQSVSKNMDLKSQGQQLQKNINNMCYDYKTGNGTKGLINLPPIRIIEESVITDIANRIYFLKDDFATYVKFNTSEFAKIFSPQGEVNNAVDFCKVYDAFNKIYSNTSKDIIKNKIPGGSKFVNFLVTEFSGYLWDMNVLFHDYIFKPLDEIVKVTQRNKAYQTAANTQTKETKTQLWQKLVSLRPIWAEPKCNCIGGLLGSSKHALSAIELGEENIDTFPIYIADSDDKGTAYACINGTLYSQKVEMSDSLRPVGNKTVSNKCG